MQTVTQRQIRKWECTGGSLKKSCPSDRGFVFEYEASKGSQVTEAPAFRVEGSLLPSHWGWGEEVRLEAVCGCLARPCFLCHGYQEQGSSA